jgi:predicted DNA binding CopG/RHH family protein
VKNARARGDATLEDFARRDQSAVVAAGSVLHVRQRATSIKIPEALLAALKARAAKKGIPYQSLLKMIVTEHLDEY